MQFQFVNNDACVQMAGDLTFTDHATFKTMTDRLFGGAGPSVIMDLAKLDFIDSAGLGMLLLAKDTAEKSNRKLVLRNPTGQVKRMFGLTKFDTLFAVEG
jgi:HptB-dependent secretion and biofilm anti anti-sigma factor